MKRALEWLLLLYLIALHCSIAAMEILSWSFFVLVIVIKIRDKSRFVFPLLWPLLGLACAVLISLLSNPPIKPFWMQFGFMRWIFLLWGFTWGFKILWRPEFEKKLLTIWASLQPLVAGNAFFQFLSGVDLFHSRSHIEPLGALHRATSFFSMSLTYAYAQGISFFACLMPVRQLKQKYFFWLVAISGPVGLISSGARGAWLAALLCGLVFVTSSMRKFLPHFVVAAVAVVALLGYISPKFNQLLHFHLEWSGAVRLQIWRAYFEMFLDHPFNGAGIFHGDKLLPEYYARHGVHEEFTSHAHNVLLQWLGGAGIFALGFYLWASLYLLRAAWRLRKASIWGWSLLLAQLFFHFGGLTEANFFDGEVNHFIVFVWAMTLALESKRARERE